ncbi:hypothetical protein, partial [Treponema phagedenis]|uniref:hypothetical protein n=1 Tax=Treponema phagedenis TaxID=162 RepID=UPI001C06CB75
FQANRFGFAMDGKIRTGTDARGSTQTGLVLPRTAKSEPPRMAVVPRRNDVLKAQIFSKCF